jgi:hypothetical protein
MEWGDRQGGRHPETSRRQPVIALVAAVSAATAKETRDVPTDQLGLKRSAASPGKRVPAEAR